MKMKYEKSRPIEPIQVQESTIYEGNALHVLRKISSESVQAVVTSPPYWGMRNYGIEGQIGLEPTLDQYINTLTRVFSEVKRVLKSDGVLWINMGDGYTSGNRGYRSPDKKNGARGMVDSRPDTPEGLKRKDLLGLPWRMAFALQADGWYLRNDIIWNKPNAMPESVKDRPARSHEYIFMLTKSEKYKYNYDAVKENAKTLCSRGLRSVWSVNTTPFPGAHYATFPCGLIEPCVLATSNQNDFVLDPFFGSGTVGVVCQSTGRNFIGVELNPEYAAMAFGRLCKADAKLTMCCA